MIASFRSRTSAATSRPGRMPLRCTGPIALGVVLSLAGGGCGSSSSTPADGGGSGGTAGTGTAAGTGGKTGTGGSAVSPDAGADARKDSGGTTLPNLAMACTTDNDCTGGLVCLKANGNDFFDLGGPPHGYCSIPCSGASDQKCTNIGGACTDVSNQGDGSAYLCVLACTLGSSTTGVGKCQGRSDLACTGTSTANPPTSEGICMPGCSSASECPANTSCDFGICIRTSLGVPVADPVGTHCTPPASAAAADTCAGSTSCITLTALTSGMKNVCTRGCVLGSPTACDPAVASSATGKNHGACVGTFSSTDDVGDFGFCVQECDSAADCLDQVDSSLVCDQTNVTILGHGLCNWN